MRFVNLAVILMLSSGQVRPDQCKVISEAERAELVETSEDGLENYSIGLPDLACCSPAPDLIPHECQFTSHCNSFGTCCADPHEHASYAKNRQMAQEGQCCEHAGDCQSGVCISGACWPKLTIDGDHHAWKTLATLAGISAILLCFCSVSCCYMRTLKMRISLVATSSSQHRI